MPPMDQLSDPIKIVASAVTPVVMISTTVFLISVVISRYVSISDRIRALAREYRDQSTSNERRSNIRRQMVIFHQRLRLVSWASLVLYTAVGCFVAICLLISVSAVKPMLLPATLVMFFIGLILIALAILLQLLELHQSHKTIEIEAAEVLSDSHERSRAAARPS
jgi:hypothetical protein